MINTEKRELFLKNFQKMFGMRLTLSKLAQKGYSPDYHYTEIRCIELIGKMEDANVTKLSEMLYMTRGGISKTIHKLLKQGAIESYQKPDNKKEVYFKLTDLGADISLKHDEFSISQKERDSIIFNMLSEEEKNTVIMFFARFNQQLEDEMSKIDVSNLEDNHNHNYDDKHHNNEEDEHCHNHNNKHKSIH